jgi:hypothetical protein
VADARGCTSAAASAAGAAAAGSHHRNAHDNRAAVCDGPCDAPSSAARPGTQPRPTSALPQYPPNWSFRVWVGTALTLCRRRCARAQDASGAFVGMRMVLAHAIQYVEAGTPPCSPDE